jgi:hypothetical protein
VPFNRHQLEPELALFGIEGCEIGFPERVDLAERVRVTNRSAGA